MPQKPSQDHWERAWRDADPARKSWYQDRPEASLEMVRACALARDEAFVDIGGGASTLVDHLLRDGYRNLAVVDIAQSALDTARRRLGGMASHVDWHCADITHWSAPHPVRLWHDRAVFHFLTTADERAHYCETAKKAILPGGYLIMATFAPDGPERCSGLPVCRYDAPMLAAMFTPDFDLIEAARDMHITPGGKAQIFQYCRFRRL